MPTFFLNIFVKYDASVKPTFSEVSSHVIPSRFLPAKRNISEGKVFNILRALVLSPS